MKKILLGQLAARGDCLYATVIARQIKYDYPDCHLTWAIGSMCKSILDNNPYVDVIWEIPILNHSEVGDAWNNFEKEALNMKKKGLFDEIFLTQISPNNFQNFDGTVRASIFRGYPNAITVPIDPIINLSIHEIKNVYDFSELHKLKNYSVVILFECTSKSGQSFVDIDYAFEVSKKIVDDINNVCVILSSDKSIKPFSKNIIDGSVLSFRENLELTKYCNLLIGCSSGISWLCTSQNAKPINKIQLLKKNRSVFASMVHDFKYFGKSTDQVLEMTECESQKVFECVKCIILNNFALARQKFHEKIPVKFDFYFDLMSAILAKRELKKYFKSILNIIKRYGVNFQLIKSFFFALPKNLYRLIMGK